MIQKNFVKYRDSNETIRNMFRGSESVALHKRFQLLERGYVMVLKDESRQPNSYFNSLDVSLSCPEPVSLLGNPGKENKHDSNKKIPAANKSKQLVLAHKKPTPLSQINN